MLLLHQKHIFNNFVSDETGTTFVDELIKCLSKTSANPQQIEKLQEYVESQEFDSDAIKCDVDDMGQSNLVKILKDESLTDNLQDFILNDSGLVFLF